MEFSTLDFETTGLSPAYHHRVIEVGVVRTDEHGHVVAEYSSLINPGRDLGRQDIHRIEGWEVLDAPSFEEIAGDLLRILDGSVLIAHNAMFERQFLRAELERCGITAEIQIDCTIALIHERQPDLPRRLGAACNSLDIPMDSAHEALGDARMASRLFHRLSGAPVTEWTSERFSAPSTSRPSPPPHPRGSGQRVTAQQATSLSDLLKRLPAGAPVVAATAAGQQYLDVLESVLEDRRLDAEEAQQLWSIAAACRLGTDDVRALHTEFVTQLALEALSDGSVSRQEAEDLEAVSTILGVEDWDRILLEVRAGAAPQSPPSLSNDPSQLSPGTALCFTGEMEWGRREDLEALAVSNGLIIKTGVSRQLDILVIADPDSQSGKARKARELGVRILSEARFLHLMGNPKPPN